MSNGVSGKPLELQKVRSIASQIPGVHELSLNSASKVISFQKVDVQCRINVYYTTGTVGTCLYHPVSGKTQLFRRTVSYDILAEIFRNPRIHTGTGYFRRDQIPHVANNVDDYQEVDDEETALTRQLAVYIPQIELINARLAEIAVRRKEEERLEAARLAEERRIREEREEVQRRETARQLAAAEKLTKNYKRGNKCYFQFQDEDVEDGFPDDIDEIASVAINDDGWAIAYDSGYSTWCSTPSEVASILYRQHQKMIAYIATGPNGQYYIRKTNGKEFFSGCDEFETAIRESVSSVKFVAFGDWETFYVQFEDGSFDYAELPDALVRKIYSAEVVEALWVGEQPYGDGDAPYFVSYGMGKCSYKDLPRDLQSWLSRVGTKNISVKQLLADGYSFFVRYSE